MSLSLTPFSHWPTLDRELDHDLANIHRLVNDATRRLSADEHGVYHRQPNYTYEENTDKAYIEVELPGVPKENVKLDLHSNSLIITAPRYKPGTSDVTVEEHNEEHNEEPTKKETHASPPEKPKPAVVYDLKLRVGQKYDADHIQATMLGDGLLKISIPIKHRHTVRPIQIQSANM